MGSLRSLKVSNDPTVKRDLVRSLRRFLFADLKYQVAVTFAVLLAQAFFAEVAFGDEQCTNGPGTGAYVYDKKYCGYFAHFKNDDEKPDPRINKYLGLAPDVPVRSFALVVGVSKYPNLPDDQKSLVAAAHDTQKLTEFLVNVQEFDEVVVLKDEDATNEAIEYFLTDYFVKQAKQYQKRSRFLFAFSGHGLTSSIPGAPPRLALSNARDGGDNENLVKVGILREYFDDLARLSFHVLVLINACEGGGFFSLAPAGGNEDSYDRQGARGITAGGLNDLVYSSPGNSNGSVFFDKIIEGVSRGSADKFPPEVVSAIGATGGDIVRLGQLVGWLTTEIYVLNATGGGKTKFQNPWHGSIEPVDTVAEGGFFFLTNKVVAATVQVAGFEPPKHGPGGVLGEIVDACAFTDINSTECSGAAHFPATVEFKAPSVYPIQGVDVSHFAGHIDWVAMSKRFTFAYLKATDGDRLKDASFEENWSRARDAKVVRGAYHVFRFCSSAKAQFDAITKVVPADSDALPIAVDLELYGTRFDAGCASVPVVEARKNVLALLTKLKARYGKTPVIYGLHNNAELLNDPAFKNYPFWLANYTRAAFVGASAGRSAWTFWQYTDHDEGTSTPLDRNVFNGTSEQFASFVAGE
jgi:GH25 family lysozyme M1 (1,4-beta-N-acetylmuramidase)